ncbi:YpbF family protein [Metabacillus schmidteae]|uniref:YpbF family protein n=1 Tax=Metabacillus schmidteae TaxID=2730405 RepID=UPI0015894185|nr:YpbF family protein [Metabacillus schmidteae]
MSIIEPSIQLLNNHTDEPTKQMLDHLVDRKRKFEKYKNKCFQAQFSTFILLMGFIVYLYAFIIKPTGGQIDVVFQMIFDNEIHIFFILLIVAGYATARYFKKKEDKSETEYHNLRCEVIRKSAELWPQPAQWQNRHEVFKLMKREFDINLFHESK